MGLKKDRCGIEAVVSKTCDKEHTFASLGQAEPLSVENPPNSPPPRPGNHTVIRPPLESSWTRQGISSTDKRSQETPEGVVFRVEDSRNIFPDDRDFAVLVLEFMRQHRKCQSEVSAGVAEREALARNREGLARTTANEHVDMRQIGDAHGRHVADVRHMRIAFRQHGGRKRLDLGDELALPPKRLPRHRCGFDAGKDRAEPHYITPTCNTAPLTGSISRNTSRPESASVAISIASRVGRSSGSSSITSATRAQSGVKTSKTS